MDIPQEELCQIINDLHTSGYFTPREKAEGSQIEAQLDGVKSSKSWRQVSQLDALIVRVRTQGRLTSNPKGSAPSLFKGLATAPSSVLAYRELNKEEGSAVASDRSDSPLPQAGTFQIVRLPAVGPTGTMVRR
jgi:hypothetical protein